MTSKDTLLWNFSQNKKLKITYNLTIVLRYNHQFAKPLERIEESKSTDYKMLKLKEINNIIFNDSPFNTFEFQVTTWTVFPLTRVLFWCKGTSSKLLAWILVCNSIVFHQSTYRSKKLITFEEIFKCVNEKSSAT